MSAVPVFAQPWPFLIGLFEFSVSDLVGKCLSLLEKLISFFQKNNLVLVFERSHAIHSKKYVESAFLSIINQKRKSINFHDFNIDSGVLVYEESEYEV